MPSWMLWYAMSYVLANTASISTSSVIANVYVSRFDTIASFTFQPINLYPELGVTSTFTVALVLAK